jgi:hypothetical protein
MKPYESIKHEGITINLYHDDIYEEDEFDSETLAQIYSGHITPTLIEVVAEDATGFVSGSDL